MDENILQVYLNSLTQETTSVATVKLYEKYLRKFLAWIEENKKAENSLTRDDINAYFSYLDRTSKDKEVRRGGRPRAEKKLSPTTKNLMRSVLRSYFRYRGLSNLADSIKNQKAYVKIIGAVTKEQVNGISQQRLRKSELLNSRDMLIAEALFDCGARRAELASIKKSDIKVDENGIGVVLIKGKGGKERYLVFSKDFMQQYWQYARLQKKHADSEYMFCNQNGSKISPHYIMILIKEMSARAGVFIKGASASPHRFRSGFGTDFWEKTKDLLLTQKALGHSSPQTTQRYIDAKDTLKKLVKEKVDTEKDKWGK